MEIMILALQLLVLYALFYLAKNYIPEYVREKGKNLATKEDIAKITREIERVRAEYSRWLEEYRFEIKVREQAAKVAEYLSLIQTQDIEDPSGKPYGLDYQRANQLAWELALLLPDKQYRDMGLALVGADGAKHILEVIADVRKVMLGDKAGDLTALDMLFHHPKLRPTDTYFAGQKSNNSALKENNDLLHEQANRREKEIGQLKDEISELRKAIPASANQNKNQNLSKTATDILVVCRMRDITEFHREDILASVDHPRIEGEAALEELENLELIDIGRYDDDGPSYCLTHQGKQFLVELPAPNWE